MAGLRGSLFSELQARGQMTAECAAVKVQLTSEEARRLREGQAQVQKGHLPASLEHQRGAGEHLIAGLIT